MTADDRALARRAIALIDLTELADEADAAALHRLCATAPGGGVIPPVAAVCVWPRHVALAKSLWQGRIATVVNFPSGAEPVDVVVAATKAALADGADEIDFVLPWQAFLAGRAGEAAITLAAVRAVIPAPARLKVILETGAYSDAATIRRASDLAIAGGADFIKTSTGKIAAGASPEAARAMLEAIRAAARPVGLKPSGGIRTLADARAYLDLAESIMGAGWATPETFRFGASGLHATLAGVVKSESGNAPESGY